MIQLLQQNIKDDTRQFESLLLKLGEKLTSSDVDILVKKLQNIKKRYLYSSDFHGYFHSQKVLLFTYLIAKHQNVSSEDMEILMDAAIYHDIGRMNENEDEVHGFSSGVLIRENKKNILESDIYNDVCNIDYLCAICEAHSKSDEKMEQVFNLYYIENNNLDYDRFYNMAKILKDADALDRTRFKKTSSAILEERYLRFDYSKTLVKLAEDVNFYYVMKEIKSVYSKFNAKYGFVDGKPNNEACIHGIGVDFFKLDSILDSGILSAYALIKENIDSPRNFYGSNKELWISVVDASMISEDGQAYNKYIKDNISFFCFVPRLKLKEEFFGSQADVHNKNEYNDEKYVFEKIRLEQIHSIIIPNSLKVKRVNELNYLNCATKYDIIINIIRYYKLKINEDGLTDLDESVIHILLDEFYNTMYKYELLNESEQKSTLSSYLESLDAIKERINGELQKWMERYYQFKLDLEHPTVNDAVSYVLSKHSNVEISVLDDETLNETILLMECSSKKL